jgi:hypothetical protein
MSTSISASLFNQQKTASLWSERWRGNSRRGIITTKMLSSSGDFFPWGRFFRLNVGKPKMVHPDLYVA